TVTEERSAIQWPRPTRVGRPAGMCRSGSQDTCATVSGDTHEDGDEQLHNWSGSARPPTTAGNRRGPARADRSGRRATAHGLRHSGWAVRAAVRPTTTGRPAAVVDRGAVRDLRCAGPA